ncbi:Flavin-dependent oxidoreductase, luciferase family (Includes alkanesulfonate monooxygenase SsuD and methylene tetrahydromethanopterin reductase) [Frankia canadensis]|uniref:Flavin-dependent oxidoreductase, luciferase family (Includes alkanesulfonate monooxygenase SsuD and methylene tetrahydromethanopterin reductase) n=1 Tax=Frankia canadensis TaxID=1836972 RepID=A0A2I2KPW7_9ACTN|nr:Flavin-dependent oxidoreductase, luciferase family (Includes alkanesulfonate monooxygenase SsuD and methylene tetrahydromethanopterin reductase) [Frankia canadensis]SOU54990.1 Flavin-dependent oxidoreductase, luciferase family (Includes alkanesulfonate monooxygenase SsuD and methylene tetrahydromethanopterin reductase) [Frankia canadensis]
MVRLYGRPAPGRIAATVGFHSAWVASGRPRWTNHQYLVIPLVESVPGLRDDAAVNSDLTLGVAVNDELLAAAPAARRAILDHLADAGLDHLTVGDHISFHGGTGFDGIVAATTALASHDTLKVLIGVYLAGLRHPMATARSLATLTQVAPGRLILGVGVAGEDRAEVSNMGVDPATRGRRMDETLGLLRRLATGEAVDHRGRFFQLENARILPALEPRVPILIGGAGEVAVRRTAADGDGWLGMWCSARRYAATHQQILAACSAAGRPAPTFAGLNVWVGFGRDAATARAALGERMSHLYNLPAEKFAHISAAGTPRDVAGFLTPYVQAGARTLTLIPVADTVHAAIEQAAEVRDLLRGQAVEAP